MGNTMREKFEEWWRDYNTEMGVELSDIFAFERDEDGDYTLMSTQDAWAGWQAAIEHASQPPAPAVSSNLLTLLILGNQVDGARITQEQCNALLAATQEPKNE